MKIVTLGGGPAGLYFNILLKRRFPAADLSVIERNRADDTFGWGVVFSDETLGNFEDADPESYASIRASFANWTRIDTFLQETRGAARRMGRGPGQERARETSPGSMNDPAPVLVASDGHAFCGLSRKRLLTILQERCSELGVSLEFQRDITTVDAFLAGPAAGADVVIAADGVNSLVRERFAGSFRPKLDWRKCKFCWLGTTKPLDAFTFVFKENEHGLFQVHAYPFDANTSTWIVECQEDTWRRAGLDRASETETVAYCERLFAAELDGHRLLGNKSLWRTFPTITNECWYHENIVLVGDAAHTAHFSIGSGTKLAMEDAIVLVDAFSRRREALGDGSAAVRRSDVTAILNDYDDTRRIDVIKTQKAAQTSLEWFENSRRYLSQPPLQFQFNLMTRSKRITYDNLALRDPEFVAAVTEWFSKAANGATPKTVPIFTPFRLRGLDVANRIVVSPMCQYSSTDGTPDDWHLVHLGSRAIGGAGLVIVEMTNVLADGRITHGCSGMYRPEHPAAWKRIVEFVHTRSHSKIGIQLAHAGRKGSTTLPWDGEERALRPDEGGWETIGPSAIPFYPGWPAPRAMTRTDMDQVRDAFVRATRGAEEAGFDLIELHAAHGYLLSSFISPLSNHRTDDCGGSLENRMRFPLEVFDAVRGAWPKEKPISVRISASDWMEDGSGVTPDESVLVARMLKEHGCDVIDVSSAGNAPESNVQYGRMYQVPFAEQIRAEAGIPVMAVGGIMTADHANTVIAAGRADLCAIARSHLSDAYLTLHAAMKYGHDEQYWPPQYLAAKPKPRE